MIWASLLLVVALLLPALAAVVLLVKLIHMARTRRVLPPRGKARWGQLAGLVVAAGFVVYGIGNWQGHLIDPRGASEICGAPVTRPLDQSPLPLHNVCHVTSGGTFDLVQVWINPALAVAVALALVCLILAIRDAVRPVPATPQLKSSSR